jgi:hypothetical protein
MIWSILGVELTLSWNRVTDVYDVNTTGQIIPLILGMGILVLVIWRLIYTESSETQRHPDIEKFAAIQRPDGTWA